MMRLAIAFLIGTLAASPAWSQDEEHKNYFGASVGFTEVARSCFDDLASQCQSQDGAIVRVFGGHRFNQHFALEGAVLGAERSESALFDLSAVGSLPVSERVAFFGRLGAFFSDRASSTSGVTVGVGLRFDVNESLGLRLEWQSLSASSGGSGDYVSLGAYLRF